MNTVFHCIHIDEDMYTSAIVIAQNRESALEILNENDWTTDWDIFDVYPTTFTIDADEHLISIRKIEKD